MRIIRKIFAKLFLSILSIKILNTFLLRLNDVINNFLRCMLRVSLKIREIIYDGGRLRLSLDHDISLFYKWQIGKFKWLKIPSFSLFALDMFKDKKVLELCCANGWFYREIYSNYRDLEYCGVDFSEDTIKEAKRKVKNKEKRLGRKLNPDFRVADITKGIPEGEYTNVFWYSAMSLFDEENRNKILKQIAERLDFHKGILSGNAAIRVNGEESWFKSAYNNKEELKNELLKYFQDVVLVNAMSEDSIFFMATNGNLKEYINLTYLA